MQILDIFFQRTSNKLYYGPTQGKCRLLISSIFEAINFQHFLKKMEIILQNFRKMLEIQRIKNATN